VCLVAHGERPGVVDHQEAALGYLYLIRRHGDSGGGGGGEAVNVGDDVGAVAPQRGLHGAGVEYVPAWRVDAQMDRVHVQGGHLPGKVLGVHATEKTADYVIDVDRGRIERGLHLEGAGLGFVVAEQLEEVLNSVARVIHGLA